MKMIHRFKIMILRLTLPYMSFEDVGKIKDSLTKEDLKFYFIERFNLTGNDAKIISDELEIYPALMERLVNRDKMIENVLSNQFITDSRLKVRMYLALQRNDNRLLKYYNDNFYMINEQVHNINVDVERLLLLPFPFVLDDRRFEYSYEEQTVKITNTSSNNVICVIDLNNGRASLIENGYENKDIAFMLMNVEFIKELLFLYNTKPKKRRLDGNNHGHRRPKVRRR